MWRGLVMLLGMSPEVSVILAMPLMFIGALAQSQRPLMFVGLAFNMCFAVLGQLTRVQPDGPLATVWVTLALLAGIGVSYTAFRWIMPMNSGRKFANVQRAMRNELTRIVNSRTVGQAERHRIRLHRLVLDLMLRTGDSEGAVAVADAALANLSVGNALTGVQDALAQRRSLTTLDGFVSKALKQIVLDDFISGSTSTAMEQALERIDQTLREIVDSPAAAPLRASLEQTRCGLDNASFWIRRAGAIG